MIFSIPEPVHFFIMLIMGQIHRPNTPFSGQKNSLAIVGNLSLDSVMKQSYTECISVVYLNAFSIGLICFQSYTEIPPSQKVSGKG